jgi:hypothetical protein
MDPELLNLSLKERSRIRTAKIKEQKLVDEYKQQNIVPSNIVSPTMPIQVPVSIPASRDPLATTGKTGKDSEDKQLKLLERIANNTENSVAIESASLGP